MRNEKFMLHIPSESETVLAMILFANWSGHTESFLSWLGASESQPPRVCEIFQPAVALRLSGEEHPSNVEVILGEEHPSSCSGVILSLYKHRLDHVAVK